MKAQGSSSTLLDVCATKNLIREAYKKGGTNSQIEERIVSIFQQQGEAAAIRVVVLPRTVIVDVGNTCSIPVDVD